MAVAEKTLLTGSRILLYETRSRAELSSWMVFRTDSQLAPTVKVRGRPLLPTQIASSITSPDIPFPTMHSAPANSFCRRVSNRTLTATYDGARTERSGRILSGSPWIVESSCPSVSWVQPNMEHNSRETSGGMTRGGRSSSATVGSLVSSFVGSFCASKTTSPVSAIRVQILSRFSDIDLSLPKRLDRKHPCHRGKLDASSPVSAGVARYETDGVFSEHFRRFLDISGAHRQEFGLRSRKREHLRASGHLRLETRPERSLFAHLVDQSRDGGVREFPRLVDLRSGGAMAFREHDVRHPGDLANSIEQDESDAGPETQSDKCRRGRYHNDVGHADVMGGIHDLQHPKLSQKRFERPRIRDHDHLSRQLRIRAGNHQGCVDDKRRISHLSVY